MAFDESLAQEIRAELGSQPRLTEKEMFGGIAFMVNGNMAVGVSGDELMVRVGKEAHDEFVSLPGARPFDKSGRPMRGWLSVAPEGFPTPKRFAEWVRRGVAFAESLPPK